jgi:hypothetical protein
MTIHIGMTDCNTILVNFLMKISLQFKGQLVLQPVVILTMIIPCQYFSINKKIFYRI